ncbi:MAG TPA: hypothetical protein VGL72_09095 [Bryobacteraceae bacterium]|jgi:hypothetical protein
MTAFRFVIPAFVGICTAAAYGQAPATTPDQTPSNPAQNQPAGGPVNGARNSSQNSGNRNNQATPGQVINPLSNAPQNPNQPGQNPDQSGQNPNGQGANDNANKNEGPEIMDDPNATPEQKASAEYSGPAVLSRGISASEPLNPKNTRLTPSVGVEYVWDSGLSGISNNGNGTNASASGVQLTYSLKGEKVYRRDVFSLGFVGDVYHYANNSFLDGTDDQLSLTWRHRLARHWEFGIVESLVEYNRNNLLLNGSLVNTGSGTLLTSQPQTEAFDGRVFSLENQGNLTWKVNPRLSINLSGGGFLTRRATTSLYGDTGYLAGGDVAYRFTRRVTAGAYYSYTHFDYLGIYGGSDVNTVGLTYSIAFNPRTELISRLGGSRVETTGLNSVPLTPFLSAILGTPNTIEAIYARNYTPDVNVQLRHKVSNLSLSLAVSRGVTPGNGIILTSVQEGASAGVNYKTKRWNFSSTVGYDSLGGYATTSYKYASVYLNGSVYRKIAKELDWHFRLDFHHYTFDNTSFLRDVYMVSTGLVWTPGDILERQW